MLPRLLCLDFIFYINDKNLQMCRITTIFRPHKIYVIYLYLSMPLTLILLTNIKDADSAQYGCPPPYYM